MKKIKKFWEKLKYWQKGAIVGIIFGLISWLIGSLTQLILPSVDLENPSSVLIYSFALLFLGLYITGRILFPLNYNMDENDFINLVFYAGSFIGIIFYTLIGALIGLIIGKLKKK